MSEVYVTFSSGAGPRECAWVVGKLVYVFQKEATRQGFVCHILHEDSHGSKDPESLLVKLQGDDTDHFLENWLGTIRWVGQSPFRPHHKRKNWYVSVQKTPTMESLPDLQEKDITYQAMRASGPGGQHVNTTDSAVRATYQPSGISVVAMEERSQHANKKIARLKLASLFQEQAEKNKAQTREQTWRQNRQLERGNEVRAYYGEKFKIKVNA